MQNLYIGVDVGSGSVRAGLFDTQGKKLAQSVSAIKQFRPAPDFVEQSYAQWQVKHKRSRNALTERILDDCSEGYCRSSRLIHVHCVCNENRHTQTHPLGAVCPSHLT